MAPQPPDPADYTRLVGRARIRRIAQEVGDDMLSWYVSSVVAEADDGICLATVRNEGDWLIIELYARGRSAPAA